MGLFRGKKGVGPIGAIFLFIVFLILWFVFLAGFVNEMAQNAVVTNDLTGIEAFFLNNLNFVILIFMILGMLGWMWLSSEQ